MPYLSPVGNEQQNDSNGSPLAGGLIYTYQAGTTTPIATYTDSTGGTAQANPIVLNASGLPASPIWLPNGQAVKLVIQNASAVTQRTVDGVTGINDPAGAASVSEWVTYTGTPTYISATSFSLAGDQTGTFQVNRRVKSTNTGGTRYSTVTASSYATGITTVTVSNDSGTLDSGLTAVSYALLSATNRSLPVAPAFSAYQSASHALTGAAFTKIQFQTKEFDTASAFDATTNYRFQPLVAGYYQVNLCVRGSIAGELAAVIYKNGAAFKTGADVSTTTVYSSVASALVFLNGSTDYVEGYAFASVGGTTTNAADKTYFQGYFVRSA